MKIGDALVTLTANGQNLLMSLVYVKHVDIMQFDISVQICNCRPVDKDKAL